MPNLQHTLNTLRQSPLSQLDRGHKFEQLILRFLQTDPTYAAHFREVLLWPDFARTRQLKTTTDLGIDIVALTHDDSLAAIQCKFYAESTTLNKPEIDSFLSAASATYRSADGHTYAFHERYLVTTTQLYGHNAREILEQSGAVEINIEKLENSPVDWCQLALGNQLPPRQPATPRDYQQTIIERTHQHFLSHNRGTLVMACGTGKTLTSLFITQDLFPQGARILFLAPSIALVAQTLRSWFTSAAMPLDAACVCSDSNASLLYNPDDDHLRESLLDLPIPSCTDPRRAADILRRPSSSPRLNVIFSTYQSIEVVHEAQKIANVDFDLVICDEAHRTASSILNPNNIKRKDKNDDIKKEEPKKDDTPSPFIRVHDANFIRATRRLYMTATPKVYEPNEKQHAHDADDTLFSMDDETIFGPRIYTLSFGAAVERKLLTDYKVLVLTVNANQVSADFLNLLQASGPNEQMQHVVPEMTARMLGALAAMSKLVVDNMPDAVDPFADDPDPRTPLKTAIAFCDYVTRRQRTRPGSFVTSETAKNLMRIAETYRNTLSQAGNLTPDAQDYINRIAHVNATDVSGDMPTNEREKNMQALRNPLDGYANIVCNVNCLSEGVDVPALDAVIFLAPKTSPITLVQSVGRVMRRFQGKRFGYVIVPVICNLAEGVDKALEQTEFQRVWNILCAMRSHDERLSAELSSHTYQHVRIISPKKPKTVGPSDGGNGGEPTKLPPEVTEQFYTMMVNHCGDRHYWPRWSEKAGAIALSFTQRINTLLEQGRFVNEMDAFVRELQRCMNPSISRADAVDFLAQHLVTRPVFDALFADYHFAQNNAVSRAMEQMLNILESEAFTHDRDLLDGFNENVRMVAKGLDTTAKRQNMVKTLYENFFATAFPRVSAQLGIVYTPIECVDFIIHSVDHLLQRDFHSSLATPGIRTLDPFAGTGTFTTRTLAYLDSQGIPSDALRHKYASDILCNEIVPLSYYVADVNIETVYNGLPRWQSSPHAYEPYNGINLADTFALAEEHQERQASLNFPDSTLARNTDAALSLLQQPINVIYGNPPYSVGQRSANDNAQNVHYPHLEARIAQTYARESSSTNKNALYDSYIKAFRWASDRLRAFPAQGGIVAFISNGAWIDGNSQAGLRATFPREFDRIYVLNLRGNQRTSGELSRREGGKIFGSGSRTPIAITLLERLPQAQHAQSPCQIFYHDIGDYLSRDEKLARLASFQSIASVPWTPISPNAKHDWINQRDGSFDTLTPLAPEKKYDPASKSWFNTYSRGYETARDPWVYNFSKEELQKNVNNFIDEYNRNIGKTDPDSLNYDAQKISWSTRLISKCLRGERLSFVNDIREAMYRPFVTEYVYCGEDLINRTGQFKSFFPTPSTPNLVICVDGLGGTKDFSCLITDKLPDLQVLFNGQCFPLYYYTQPSASGLFGNNSPAPLERHCAISDFAVQSLALHGISASKEDIFFALYAALHNPQWRQLYADDLRKSLPRLNLPNSQSDFNTLCAQGHSLANLHLAPTLTPAMAQTLLQSPITLHGFSLLPDSTITLNPATSPSNPSNSPSDPATPTASNPYPPITKMSLDRASKSRLDIAPGLHIDNIPPAATQYIVNGKSPLEWIVERFADTTDPKTHIRNNINSFAPLPSLLNTILRTIAIAMITQDNLQSHG